MLQKLQATEWVSYIEPPPRQPDGTACSAQQVLKYLARYLTGGPISDRRILSADEDHVTFSAREGKTPGGDDRCVPITLTPGEFTRRWCLHILPKGFTKTRRFGGWSNRHGEAYLERSAILLEASPLPREDQALEFPPPSEVDCSASSAAPSDTCSTSRRCPHCRGELRLITETLKPSWRDVLGSNARPPWYPRPPEQPPVELHPPRLSE